MNTFNRKIYFNTLSDWLSSASLKEYGREGGFTAPNDFDISNLLDLLNTKKFPTTHVDCCEFAWAIYESGATQLMEYDASVQVFVSSVLLYCHRETECIGPLDEMYYFILAKSAGTAKVSIIKEVIHYLDWMRETISLSSPPNNDVFLDLAKLYLRAKQGRAVTMTDISKIEERALNNDSFDSIFEHSDQRWTCIYSEIADHEIVVKLRSLLSLVEV